MSSWGGIGDGPAILQLQKWGHLKSQLEPSKYCLASLSPTRELLLLLSYECEALLLPLTFGKSSSENLHEPNSPEPSSTCRSESIDSARCSTKAGVPVKNILFRNRGSSSSSQYPPVISGVKSLAWGHCGDVYNQFEDSVFKEFLIVSSDNGIIVHAFRYQHRNEVFQSVPEGDSVEGKWVEWGPTNNSVTKSKFSHSSTGESPNEPKIIETSGTVDVCDAVDDGGSSGRSILPKNWFQTFHMELDTVVSNGKYSARFPAKSSIPLSADVVSLDIGDNTSKFIEFFSSSTLYGEKENISDGPVVGQVGDPSLSDRSSKGSVKAGGDIIYRCSRVFNNSSHRLIGLVLNFPEDVSDKNSEFHVRNTGKDFVVVMMLNQWGLQWICSVDLQHHDPSSFPSLEWADFQFSNDFLICLNSSGLICIWNVLSGGLVTHFDVLKSCGLDRSACFRLSQSEPPVNRHLASTKSNFSQEVDKKIEVSGRETCGDEIVCARTFRRLMVISHSFLLAVVDDHGVIYVIRAAEYVSKKCATFENFVHSYKYSDSSMLAGWKVADCEIDCAKILSDLSTDGFSNKNHSGATKFRKRHHHTDGKEIHKFRKRHHHTNGNESESCTYSSGFSTSQINGRKVFALESEISSTPLRKVFLPLDRFNKEDCICFSPIGITRFVRRLNMKQQKVHKIVHTSLHVVSPVLDDIDLGTYCSSKSFSSSREVAFSGESIGFSFQGCLYLVTEDGLSVILPSISISSSILPAEFTRYWQPTFTAGSKSQIKTFLAIDEMKELGRPWQIEVLDRTLLYEGPDEAERISLENGWDLRMARIRRMQLALHYLKADEIEKSLDMLVDVNLAEEGILHLLFTSIYRIFCKAASDSEVALASRLLALAASFATKMVRRYGLGEHKKEKFLYDAKELQISYAKPLERKNNLDEIGNSRRLSEMAQFLEVIRNIQAQLSLKGRKLGKSMAGGMDAAIVTDIDVSQDDPLLPSSSIDAVSHGLLNTSEARVNLPLTATEVAFDNSKTIALSPLESAVGEVNMNKFPEAGIVQNRTVSMEIPSIMIARWAIDNIDVKAMVKDALDSGHLPLAVLQLHLLQQKELVSREDSPDTFSEIREIGRAIAYDLFLKGESGLAVETLLKLGEDVEVILRELLFSTVRRSLRKQITEEMNKNENLRPHEWKILERIFLIERLYPSFSFWETFLERQKDVFGDASVFTLPGANGLKLNFHVHDNLILECGDIDGAVTGSWATVAGGSPEVCEASPRAGYWVCAAIWSYAWDQRTVDRIVLDQPLHVEVHVAWESQLEYHMCRSNWEQVCKLLDAIPTSLLSEGSLEINLNSSQISTNTETCSKFPDHAMYICAAEELEPVCMDIPDVKIFTSPVVNTCSSWLKMLVELELARKFIFLKDYWENTTDIIPLLARAGLTIDKCRIVNEPTMSSLDLAVLDTGRRPHKDAGKALHKLVVSHCTQYNLPNLLDLYLDHCNLDLDDDLLSPLLDAAGDCQWAKWLLFSRNKRHVYEASLSNARSNLSRRMIHGSNLSVLEFDEIIHTVDDMAEGGGEMAALATLMYAASPMQKCLCAGSVNRQCSFTPQCTLENLRPGLQHFPTLWRTLVNACFGQDDNACSLNSDAVNVFGKSLLSDYLGWRDTIFCSTGGDTSLIQMLPCWFSKSVRRLVTLFVQGPLGWQSLSGAVPTGESSFYGESSYVIHATGNAGVTPINWEAAIQKSVEELYSSVEDKGFGVEHHLHRGRALAAFNHILGLRVSKLKSAHTQRGLSGQTNIQSDMQAILAPLSQSEGSLLSSVVPLAITHFEDSVLVASCAFLLELCGLSATLLRVDVAVLQRISSYYNSVRQNPHYGHVSPRESALHAASQEGDTILSLAQALADNYLHHDHAHILDQRHVSHEVLKGGQPPRSLMTVLQHLEKASLPLIDEGKTCGNWLSSGNGDGYEFRAQQKDASMRWNLVTEFCHMHRLPLSTKYLSLLANDNDWVGFLTEAQMGGFSTDVIIEVAAKEFSDPRLRIHILTVLKSMQSARKKTNSSTMNGLTSGNNEMPCIPGSNSVVSVELFGILAECERQKNPGEALLTKAKDLSWSLLAMIASCFSDVSALSCLMVWLEITAARETSSIKVNDISSKIASSVGAAVEATNKLPSGSRSLMFRYNRRKPKRRCLMEPASGDSPDGLMEPASGDSPDCLIEPASGDSLDGSFNIPSRSRSAVASISQEVGSEETNEMCTEKSKLSVDSDEGLASLSNMIAVLCGQHLFLPLLRAFEMFLPSCSLLPFVRFCILLFNL
ncbi:uncharacterized protein A4U43_C01F22320 [Asparagus officinalis]|uniref:Spatacsin C-terminal domain-containing protein n=1 Tax=Asparagus officinalis TaxID=4686 RepID=A0A5P1FR94_ASPOF|nr:uncharacterized protein A4U43_C01F22320 [Asparagus officinalis]